MKKILGVGMLAALMLVAYLGLWPVPIHAVSWQAPTAPGLSGAYAVNDKLQGTHAISLAGEVGPEHIVVGHDGKLYTAVVSGKVLRLTEDGNGQEVFALTGGRPLGLAFDAHNNLVVADAYKGLLSITHDGKVRMLTNAVDGQPIRFANSVAVAGNGKIYFTDSSTRFVPADRGGTVEAALLDVFEQSATGRVLEFDPAMNTTRIVAAGLSLANGVVLSSDERDLYIAESARYRVWKIPVGAHNVDIARHGGEASVVLDNLPGFPDNLTRGLDGKIWLGLAGVRNGLDAAAAHPFLREMVLRVPRALWVMPKPYGHVIAFTEDGKVVADLQDPSGTSQSVTGVTETAGRLYIQSVDATSVRWLAR